MRSWCSCCCFVRTGFSGNRSAHEAAGIVALAGARFLRGHGRGGPLMNSFWQSLLTLVFFYAYHGHVLEPDDDRGIAVARTRAVSRARRLCDCRPHRNLRLESLAFACSAAPFSRRASAARWHGSARAFRCAACISRCSQLPLRSYFGSCSTTGSLSAAPAAIFLKAINPDTNRPLAKLRGGTLFFYLAFLCCHGRRLFRSSDG